MAKAPDPLAKYNAKRDFSRTAEPAGTLEKGKGNRFIVQKHDASRLHYDFRIEVDGVLKSWAVTRGPSLNPDDKRLAVRTEDHPLSYGDFEGVIPAKEYGGGTVMLWDDGSWAPIAGKSAKDIEDGHLHFILDGQRMRGEWMMIRLKPRGKERGENWLLRKVNDAYAGGSDALVEGELTSVKTGRTMAEIAEGKAAPKILPQRGRGTAPAGRGGGGEPQAVRSRKAPSTAGGGFRALQLATLVDSVPAGNGWLHEVKYDGYRALISTGPSAKVFTRSGLDWSDKFPGIVAVAETIAPALIDGEIVAFKDGKPDFSTLQKAISEGGDGLTLFAFDLLAEGGEDLAALPLVQRKERLRPLIPAEDDRIQFAEHVVGAGEELFEAMCREGYEGIVSKKIDAPYRGTRTKAWLKVKCTRRQEFVIVGWLPTKAKGRGFASLLVGLHGDDGLVYAGKVGTGFDAATQDDLLGRLEKLARKTAPVDVPQAAARGAQWVTPKLVAEVAFAEFTGEGVLRHASYLGLRGDKAAKDVVAEVPVAVERAASSVKISSADRIIFPEDGITKGQLADYYADVAGILLPFAANRPISLVRCPQGRAKQCFFQKHDAGSFGKQVHQVDIREKDGSTEPYLYVDDADGLAACVQMGTIEFHGWGSLVGDVEKPDRLVFDLDPDEGLGFDEVKRAAIDIKTQLADLGLTSFAMLSGGKGVHVVVPLTPVAQWPAVKSFADRFCRALAANEPERYVATMSKAKRKGRIFLDWLRNQRGSTAVLPYVARARPGAPVAAPVSWTELKDIDTPARWSVRDAAELIERANGRGLAGWGAARQVLPDL
ncbi:DNA ligase D [Sphingomonas qomolangmaensis]|uniref:DNA ligase (ATP) n=1 Tax=Sphingomonas qomolangmaensis TaxID=2918765 RepID=A0ABY5L783_9SPHN|nr:DNA ligase D [Sphingomonas qomolangmaensis]UUL81836.1 DNA ligase D [Sphingomonas qomolangmaensis]